MYYNTVNDLLKNTLQILMASEVFADFRLVGGTYPYSHDKDLILKNFIDLSAADDDFDPFCLHGKYWEFIKEDIEEAVNKYLNS